jgi:predicted ABC-type ATPase
LFHLFFMWLPSADMAVQRVADRARSGGHHVPEDTIRRRYERGLDNFFKLYRELADKWRFFDNSDPSAPKLLAKGSGTIVNSDVRDRLRWNRTAMRPPESDRR